MQTLFRVSIMIAIAFVFVPSASAQEATQFGAPVMTPIIVGKVLSVNSRGAEFPLSSESGWVQTITVRRMDPGTGLYDHWVNMTDCWANHQGCADQFGSYRFSQSYDGNNLIPGDYEVVVEAWGHVLSRRRLLLDASGVHEIEHRMQMKPFTLDYVYASDLIPSDGGVIALQAQTCNLDTNMLTSDAHVLMLGPTATQEWGSYQVSHEPVSLPAEKWTCSNVTLTASFAESLPNGRFYCATFTLGEASAPMGEVTACAKKVEFPSGKISSDIVRK